MIRQKEMSTEESRKKEKEIRNKLQKSKILMKKGRKKVRKNIHVKKCNKAFLCFLKGTKQNQLYQE